MSGNGAMTEAEAASLIRSGFDAAIKAMGLPLDSGSQESIYLAIAQAVALYVINGRECKP